MGDQDRQLQKDDGSSWIDENLARVLGSVSFGGSLAAPFWIPIERVAGAHGLELIVLGIIYALRWLMHWLQGYTRHTGKHGPCLRRLMRIDGLLAVLLLSGAIWCAHEPTTSHLLIVTGVLWPPMALISSGIVRVSRRARLKRASDHLRTKRKFTEFSKWLKTGDELPFVGHLRRAIEAKRPKQKLSAYTVAILLLLGGIAATSLEALVLPQGVIRHQGPSAAVVATPLQAAVAPVVEQLVTPTLLATAPTAHAVPAGTTYAELCDTKAHPGDGAPQPQAGLLRALWEGGPGVEGLGGAVAGCAQPARPERHQPGVWWTRGVCGAELRSVAVASPSEAAILLQGAAEFALPFVLHGGLLGAEKRTQVRTGDVQVVHTTAGNYVLVRPATSRGVAAPVPAAGRCQPFGDDNVPYVALPPAMAALWVELAGHTWTWPETNGSLRRFRFVAPGQGERVVAFGVCEPNGSCRLDVKGRRLRAGAGKKVTTEQVLRAAARD